MFACACMWGKGCCVCKCLFECACANMFARQCVFMCVRGHRRLCVCRGNKGFVCVCVCAHVLTNKSYLIKCHLLLVTRNSFTVLMSFI